VFSGSHDNSASCPDDTTRRFVLWALATLDLPIESADRRVYAVSLPESNRDSFDGAETIRFALDAESVEADSSVKLAAPGSRLYLWLVDQLRQLGAAAHAAPKQQPAGIHEITPHLFGAFQVDGGRVHLGGCRFEDQPLVRLTYRAPAADDPSRKQLVHVYAWADGEPVEVGLLEALQVDELTPRARPAKLAEAQIESWVAAGRRLAEQRMGGRRQEGAAFDVATIVWCKYVEGKLTFAIGENSVERTFSGWAEFFAQRRILPPPYLCPLSGEQSYHLAATDDGRITALEAIAVCEESGQRVLKGDLQVCGATGKRVLPAHLETCPVTGMRVARSCLAVCSSCRQRVSPTTIQNDCCLACRSMRAITRSDHRLARVLDRYPKLQRWRRWTISETSTVYVLVAASLLRRLLIVLDKQQLEPLHMAARACFSRPWSEIAPQQRDDRLR
jgi:hypothetical protein